MITYEATTKNHFSKIFLIIIIPTSQRRGEWGFRPDTGDIQFIAKRMSERNAGSVHSEMAQKELSSSIKQGSAVSGMKPKRACLRPQTDSLGRCGRNAKKEQNRERFFYLFQLRCRSVCHFFKR